ncbi:Gar1/Naf1 family protein [Thermococcus sp.]|uniref:Gar1/Naf1 family protein n=1 Tax=Thermococcus sp. TaxID=35749 RepID=UPI00261A8A32|nr:Gar1/Naf1 family protein [Thermococcus sp.]
MKRLGKVSHYAKQGFLIVRSGWVPSLNDSIVDKELKHVGVVKDIFGPVNHPYVAVKPHVKNPERYVGTLLYVDQRKKNGKSGKVKRFPGRRAGKRRPTPRRRG